MSDKDRERIDSRKYRKSHEEGNNNDDRDQGQ
jgi:hypothetical protein